MQKVRLVCRPATPGAGCSSVSVGVVARGTAEGKPLAEKTVTATASGGGAQVSLVTATC